MRSGTTFLANFLNSQENFTVYADMLVSLFMEAHSLGIADIHRPLSDREKNVLLSNVVQEGKLHHLDFSVINRQQEFSWYELFLQCLKTLQPNSPTAVVGVKRTREEDYVRQMTASGTKVIYCIRDPRDVVLSARNRFAQFNLFKVLDNWKHSFEVMEQFVDKSNFMRLRYEDLILHKEETSEQLSQFLECHVTPSLEKLTFGKDRDYQDNSSFGDVNRLFDPTAVNRWRNSRQQAEIIFTEYLLAPEMTKLGYEHRSVEKVNTMPTEVKGLVREYRRQKKKQRLFRFMKRTLEPWLKA